MRLKVLTTALIITALSTTPLYAHSRLTSSSPNAGAVVELFPTEISLTFNEELLRLGEKEVNTLSLADAEGVDLELAPAEVVGNSISRAVTKPAQVGGEYTVTFRVVSADGHPIKGSYTFTFSPVDSSGAALDQDHDVMQGAEESSVGTAGGTPPTLLIAVTFIAIALLAYRRFSARR